MIKISEIINVHQSGGWWNESVIGDHRTKIVWWDERSSSTHTQQLMVDNHSLFAPLRGWTVWLAVSYSHPSIWSLLLFAHIISEVVGHLLWSNRNERGKAARHWLASFSVSDAECCGLALWPKHVVQYTILTTSDYNHFLYFIPCDVIASYIYWSLSHF